MGCEMADRPVVANLSRRETSKESIIGSENKISLVSRCKGGETPMKPKRRYYSLIDKVYQNDNLYEAWLSVKKNQGSGGIDGVSIAMFEKNVSMNLRELQRLLQQGRYKPDPVKHISSRRKMCQQAVRQIIEPIFEQDFYYYSFGFSCRILGAPSSEYDSTRETWRIRICG
jgi:hypothetical protein